LGRFSSGRAMSRVLAARSALRAGEAAGAEFAPATHSSAGRDRRHSRQLLVELVEGGGGGGGGGGGFAWEADVVEV